MKTWLLSLQYFDETSNSWIDIERLATANHILEVEERVSDLGWQLIQALPLDANQIKFHAGLKSILG